MYSSEFPVTLLPNSVKDKIKFKKYKKGDHLHLRRDNHLFYIF